MSGRHPGDSEAARLREEIASDLLSLQQTFRRPGAGAMQFGGLPEQLGRLLRANPRWAVAAAAGALAGLAFSVRNRLRKPPGD